MWWPWKCVDSVLPQHPTWVLRQPESMDDQSITFMFQSPSQQSVRNKRMNHDWHNAIIALRTNSIGHTSHVAQTACNHVRDNHVTKSWPNWQRMVQQRSNYNHDNIRFETAVQTSVSKLAMSLKIENISKTKQLKTKAEHNITNIHGKQNGESLNDGVMKGKLHNFFMCLFVNCEGAKEHAEMLRFKNCNYCHCWLGWIDVNTYTAQTNKQTSHPTLVGTIGPANLILKMWPRQDALAKK